MIRPSVFWFLVCVQHFRSDFWDKPIIRTITDEDDSLGPGLQAQTPSSSTPLRDKTSERQKIETLMLWDLMFLRKSSLFTETDLKSLTKFCRSLRRPKRTSKAFVFGRGQGGPAPKPIEPSEEMFSECDILAEKDAQVAKALRGLKMRQSAKGVDRQVTLENQMDVLRMRNQLYHFFRAYFPDPPSQPPLQIELKKSENDLLILKPKKCPARHLNEGGDLMRRVRVTHIETLLRALVTMRKKNFHRIFESINQIRARIQSGQKKSRMLIETQRALVRSDDTEDLLKDMIGLSEQEKQYLIYKEKKQKMKKLRDVRVYRQVRRVRSGRSADPDNRQTPDAETQAQLSKVQHNDSICQVCTSGDYSDSNQIVFCSKCNVSVHQLCYGLSQVPEGDWICQVCLVFGARGKYLDCALCSCKGGAMKQVNVMVFDDFVKENLPVYWERQSRKINRFKQKLQFDLQVEKGVDSVKDTQLEIPCVQRQPPTGEMMPQAMRVLGQSEVDIIQRIMRTYDWKLEHSPGIFYDYYKERFSFSEEELLERQPVAMKCWVHLSCGLWMPEMFLRDLTTVKSARGPRSKHRRAPKIRRRKERLVEVASKPRPSIKPEEVKEYLSGLNTKKYQLTGLKDVSKGSLHWQCQACKLVEGATLKCYSRECTQRFHVECAKRAGLTIEAQTPEHKDFILFCEAHTPLKFKKEIEITRKRSRNEIVKFAKNLKKKLKDVLPRETMTMLAKADEEEEAGAESSQSVRDQRAPESKAKRMKGGKKKLKKKKEKKEKYSFEEKIENLSVDKKNLLLQIKNELQTSKDFFFVWDVNLGEVPQGEGLIHESIRVSLPTKSIFRNKISKSNRIWKSLAGKHSKTPRSLYERHLSIINSLKVTLGEPLTPRGGSSSPRRPRRTRRATKCRFRRRRSR